MNLKVKKSDLTFILLISTIFLRQICYRRTSSSLKVALCAFTFNYFKFTSALYIILTIALLIPTILLYVVLYDIKTKIYPLSYFKMDVFFHHLFFCFMAGCSLYSIDIVQDFLNENAEKSYNEWHKYIIHLILAPTLFVDAIYSIEIQKVVQSGKDDIRKLKGVIYYLLQAITGTYLVYCFTVVLYLEKQLWEVISCIIERRGPNNPLEFSIYLQTLSASAIECVFLILFFALIDQGVLFKKFRLNYV